MPRPNPEAPAKDPAVPAAVRVAVKVEVRVALLEDQADQEAAQAAVEAEVRQVPPEARAAAVVAVQIVLAGVPVDRVAAQAAEGAEVPVAQRAVRGDLGAVRTALGEAVLSVQPEVPAAVVLADPAGQAVVRVVVVPLSDLDLMAVPAAFRMAQLG